MAQQERPREDRVTPFIMHYMDRFVFDELSETHLRKEDLTSFMRGIPVPFRTEDLSSFKEKGGLKITSIIDNMVWVLGIHPDFMYLKEYRLYIDHYFDEKLADALIGEAARAMEREDLDAAMIYFRAVLVLYPGHKDGMFGYAGVCRSLYLAAEGNDDVEEAYVGNLKAESLDMFEQCSELHPEFDRPYYYLGYAYLNLGLYKKAELSWRKFLELTDIPEDAEARTEVNKRIEQMKDPIILEQGCNAVMAGKWTEGVQILEPYLDTDFDNWWPLFYYLGIAYHQLGFEEKAAETLRQALQLEPSQENVMEELIQVYSALGDSEMEEKYQKKMELIRSQHA